MASLADKPDLSRLKIDHQEDREPGSAPRRMSTVVWVVVAVILSTSITWLFTRQSQPSGSTAPLSVSENKQAAAPRGAAAKVLNATGYVVAQRRAAVSSKATGRLKELNVKEGDAVTANQVIGVLENDDLTQLVVKGKAAIEAIRAQEKSAETELWVAEIERNRVLSLSEKHAVSLSDRDAAEARYQRSRAEVAAQKANTAVAEALLKEAEVNLEYTFIRAPFDGTVLTKNADIGEVVAPFGSSTNARAAVVTMADMSSLQVEADVSESNIAKVSVGQRCKIVLDSFPDKTYQGMVDSIVPTVDRAKATVLVKIKFLDKDSRVIPEMSAKVEFDLELVS
jgi:HlyD family secretion protein